MGRNPRDIAGIGLVLLASGAVFPGCGNVTAGGVGQAEAVVSGNGADDAGSASSLQPVGGWNTVAAPSLSRTAGTSQDGTSFDLLGETTVLGTVTVELEVALVPDGGGSVDLSGGVRTVTVDTEGEVPAPLGAVTIPEGSYSAVRIVFRSVVADVAGGLEVGGIPIEGQVEVDFGEAESLTVERPTGIVLVDGASAVITVHLRSAAWLALVDPVSLLVPAEAFMGEVQIEGIVALP